MSEQPWRQQVQVVGFDMPFLDLMFFMVKVALASIPAMLIAGFILTVFVAAVSGAFVSTLGLGSLVSP